MLHPRALKAALPDSREYSHGCPERWRSFLRARNTGDLHGGAMETSFS